MSLRQLCVYSDSHKMPRLEIFALPALLFCCGTALADFPKEPALVILDSAGKLWETLGEAKITEADQTGLHGETGRGKKMMLMTIPLILGFKVAGIIIAALTALKVLVAKTVIMSGFAVLTSTILAAKYLIDKFKHKKHQAEPMPYYYQQAMAQPLGWEQMYDVQAGSADVTADLQGHFSQPILAAADNHTAYNYIPYAERKSYRPAYKTTVIKTTVKKIEKK